MKKYNRISAALLALAMTASITACGSTATTEATTTTPASTTSLKAEDAEAIKDIDVGATEKLANGTVKWLSFWDINPANGKAVPVELEMFETQYGGKIEYIQTTWDDRFDKLTTMVIAGDSPDMFPAGDLDVFPKGAIQGMFAPLDDYIDFNSELWSDLSVINDQFVYDGEHYVGTTSTDAGVVMIYNKRTIEENNLDDPEELLAADNWTWDTFYKMMTDFSNREESKFAVDGWWFESAFSLTTGVPYIGMKDGKVVSNLDDALIGRAQEFMYNMNKNDLPYPKWEHEWTINANNIGDGKTLFYPCGIWALYEADLTAFGEMDEIAFVPMPRCPDADAYYLPTGVDAYALCTGAKNPEGVAAFLTCKRVARDDPRAIEINEKQLFEDYHWTQSMYDELKKVQELTEQHPMVEFYPAVSPDLNEAVHNPMKDSFNNGTSWTQTKESIKGTVDAEIEKANSKLS